MVRRDIPYRRRGSLWCLLVFLSASSWLLYLAFLCSALPALAPHVVPEPPGQDLAASPVDPNKAPSELNHHIAGVFLLAIGMCVLARERYKSLAWLRWLPSILFMAAGFFLAAWSDAEMWPRGNQGWSWLIYHDPEALQHKLYALLLLTIGLIEAVQTSARYRRRRLNAAFPILFVIGGISLLFHHHSGGMNVASADQLPAPLIVQANLQTGQLITAPATTQGHTHEARPERTTDSSLAGAMAADGHVMGQQQSHHHTMAGPEARIQQEHIWFAVVGFCIAVFKILYDNAKPTARVRYLWPNSLLLLGLLLIFYTE